MVISDKLKKFLSIIVLLMLSFCGVALGVSYLESTKIEVFIKNKDIIKLFIVTLVLALTIISFIFQLSDNKFVVKVTIIFLCLISVIFLGLYLLKITGLEEKISSVESLKAYVLTYGKFIVPFFIILQFLQVIILPIPSAILHAVGIALFGFQKGVFYSIFGIVTASITAYFIGKKLGKKAVAWLVGKENLERGLNAIKGKDKWLLFLMFLFPFFPDDLLCFISGISGISTRYFIFMVLITRTVSIISTSFVLSGKIFNLSGWFLIILLIFLAITVIICIVIYKRLFKSKKGV